MADSNISQIAIENCISYYDTIQQKNIKQAQAIVKEFPESASVFQTKILNRVSLVIQNDKVEELAKQGILGSSLLSKIRQLINIE